MERIRSNASEMPNFGDLSNLSAEKLKELETILMSILALPAARETYAQIIDGTPIRTPYSDDIKAFTSHLRETIITGENSKPSDQAMQKYEEIRTKFAPQGLKVDLQLAQNYQNARPDSREHLLRLLEIAAASVNTLAGMIYASFHPSTNITPPEPPEGHDWQFRRTDHFYVDFYHTNYQRFDNYPFGLLNVVGYWAEAELFGGIVLFERGESGSEIINAFMHPQTANHAFQLSENQLQGFANLGIADNAAGIAGAETLLPFAKNPDARTELTFARAGQAPLRIYKNEYDRPPFSYVPLQQNCVIRHDEGLEEALRVIKENGWDKETYEELFQAQPSLRDTLSSKYGSQSANKKGQ